MKNRQIETLRGAESIVRVLNEGSKPIVEKYRLPRKYRIKEIDEMLRKRRTKQEAKLLRKASQKGLPVPQVYRADKYTISMEFIDGEKRDKITKSVAIELGKILAELHNTGIIHGDFTLANIIFTKKGIVIIDFGLGFFSDSIEHKAVDAFTMFKSLDESVGFSFLESYLEHVKNPCMIGARILKIRERFRYGRRYKSFEHTLSNLIAKWARN